MLYDEASAYTNSSSQLRLDFAATSPPLSASLSCTLTRHWPRHIGMLPFHPSHILLFLGSGGYAVPMATPVVQPRFPLPPFPCAPCAPHAPSRSVFLHPPLLLSPFPFSPLCCTLNLRCFSSARTDHIPSPSPPPPPRLSLSFLTYSGPSAAIPR